MNKAKRKKNQCFVFTADGKESSVLLMKNVADRMSQRNIFPRDHSLHQRLNRTALCTRLSAMAEVGRLRKGKTRKTIIISSDMKLLFTTQQMITVSSLPISWK